MAKWIKNTTGSTKTYIGKDIAAGAYREVQANAAISWANSSTLLTDIGSGDAIVAKDDSGSNDITDVNTAIKYLKDDLPQIITNAAITDPQGKRARLVGTHSATAAANTDTSSDWVIPQMQYPAGTDVISIFDGIQYYAKDSSMGDSICFSIVDIDGSGVTAGLYPQAYYDAYKDGNGELEIEKFGTTFYVAPNSSENIILYKARLYTGLVVRATFHNTHASNTVDFFCNLFRHLDP